MPNLTADFLDLKSMIDRIEFTSIMTGITYKDGSMSFSVRNPHDEYDPEKGVAFALLNRLFGHDFFKKISKYIPEELQKQSHSEIASLIEAKERLEAQNAFLRQDIDRLTTKTFSQEQQIDALKEELDKMESELEDMDRKLSLVEIDLTKPANPPIFGSDNCPTYTSTPIEPTDFEKDKNEEELENKKHAIRNSLYEAIMKKQKQDFDNLSS